MKLKNPRRVESPSRPLRPVMEAMESRVLLSTASLSGTVFNDLNADGKRETGEPGLTGRKVFLDIAGQGPKGQRIATTASTGAFSFTGVPSGNYILLTTIPTGYRATLPSADTEAITLKAGTSTTGVLLGQTQKALVRGTVFSDINGDGTQQSTEHGLAGWVVTLTGTGKTTGKFSYTTSSTGAYQFYDVPAGTYKLAITAQTGFKETAPSSGSYSLTLAAAQVVTENFGEQPPPFTFNTTRVVDPDNTQDDIVTFYAFDNATGAWAGSTGLEAEQTTLSSAGGLVIGTYSPTGGAPATTADFAGQYSDSTVSYINLDGGDFNVITTNPSETATTYQNLQRVPSFEVTGFLLGRTVGAITGLGAKMAVAVVPHDASVTLAGQIAANIGPAYDFSTTAVG